MELTLILIAIGAGILIGFPTGPARFFVVDTRLHKGRAAALKTYLGFFSAVVIYASLALLADDFISRHAKVRMIAYLVGSVLLVFWGILIIVNSNKTKKSTVNLHFSSSFLKGFTAGLSNPVTPFIYLAFLQTLGIYSGGLSFINKAILIIIFEAFGFLTTWLVAALLLKKKASVKNNWRIVKIIMGIFLICVGAYNFYSRVEFNNGIQLKEQQKQSKGLFSATEV